MTARRIRDIEKVARVAPVATIAVVLFPDDFRWEVVAATIAELRGRRRAMLPVLVTAHPRRFESLADQGALIVTRPAWGFTILDAIRAHIDGNGARKPQKARGYG